MVYPSIYLPPSVTREHFLYSRKDPPPSSILFAINTLSTYPYANVSFFYHLYSSSSEYGLLKEKSIIFLIHTSLRRFWLTKHKFMILLQIIILYITVDFWQLKSSRRKNKIRIIKNFEVSKTCN